MVPADRDINNLTPEFKGLVESFLKECKENGLNIFITEGRRTKERQEYLYAQGRTRAGSIVTWTLNSIHLTGEAIDIAFHGPELYPVNVQVWLDVSSIANKYEMEWGFDLWGDDKPHFQLKLYKMTASQKKLNEAWEYITSSAHDFGTDGMKELAAEMGPRIRENNE